MVVSAGVLLHLPMFWMGRNNGFMLAGMPMDAGMIWGMGPSSCSASSARVTVLLPKTVPGDVRTMSSRRPRTRRCRRRIGN
jgi:MFS transporter, putative metabolite:H+ symporter